jgi:hypothetical protein
LPEPLKILEVKQMKPWGRELQGFLTLEVLLAVAPERRINNEEAVRFISVRPKLADHACRQKGLGRFGEKIVGASLAHLLEHLIIDLMVERSSCQVSGNTSIANKQKAEMRVLLRFPEEYESQAWESVRDAHQLLLRLID